MRELGGFPVGEPVLGDQPGEEGAVDPPGDVVPRRDRQEGAGVVVEADGVVEARRLGRHLAEAAHALRAVVEPPGRAQLQARIMAGERRQLARIGALVEGEEDDRQARLVAEPVEQRLQRLDIIGARRDVGALVAAIGARAASDCGCGSAPGWICITIPSSRLIAAISVSIWARNSSASCRRPAAADDPARTAPPPRPRGRSAVRAVGWPWSVAVAPAARKSARRLRCAAR